MKRKLAGATVLALVSFIGGWQGHRFAYAKGMERLTRRCPGCLRSVQHLVEPHRESERR